MGAAGIARVADGWDLDAGADRIRRLLRATPAARGRSPGRGRGRRRRCRRDTARLLHARQAPVPDGALRRPRARAAPDGGIPRRSASRPHLASRSSPTGGRSTRRTPPASSASPPSPRRGWSPGTAAARPPRRPRAWVTYQSYYRAPDLVGPDRRDGARHPVRPGRHLPLGEEPPDAVPPVGQRRAAGGPAAPISSSCMSPRDRPRIAAHPGPALRGRADPRLLPPAVDLARFDATAERRAACRAPCAAFPRRRGPRHPRRRRHARAEEARRLSPAGRGPRPPARRSPRAALAPRRRRRRAGPVGGRGGAGAVPSGRVAFLGALEPESLPAAYLGADLFAFPGRFHVVYLQAAAAGLPVVACAGPGPDPMIAPDGALLTPPTPDAFARGGRGCWTIPPASARWGGGPPLRRDRANPRPRAPPGRGARPPRAPMSRAGRCASRRPDPFRLRVDH